MKGKSLAVAFLLLYLLACVGLMIALSVAAPIPIAAPVRDERYVLIANSAYGFHWLNDVPFTPIKKMCWNNAQGWCDQNFSRSRYLGSLVDRQAGIVFEIRMTKSKDFFVWGFSKYRGVDGNPHPIYLQWVTVDDCFTKGGACG